MLSYIFSCVRRRSKASRPHNDSHASHSASNAVPNTLEDCNSFPMQSLPGDRRIETYNPAINEILKHMNTTRQFEGKAPLKLHAGLCGLAQDWANEMELANQVSHSELGHLLKVSSDPHTTSENALTKRTDLDPKKCGPETNQDDEDAIQVI
ncbi:hypothetical protein LTR66_014569, partial [Elasticomyces elasticus]